MKLPIKKVKTEQEGFLVVDLAERSVKVVSFAQTPQDKLVAKGVSVREIYQDKLKPEIIKSAVAEFDAKSAIVGLSGHQVTGFLIVVGVTRENPEVEIVQKEVNLLYEQAKNAANKQVASRMLPYFADETKWIPLDLVVTKIKIDDREIEEPVGKLGRQMQVEIFCSYVRHNYYKWVLSVVKSAGLNIKALTTTVYPQSKLLNAENKNYTLIDIGKTHTDVAVILGGGIIQTRSFDMAGDFFTEYLQNKMGLDYKSANGKKEADDHGEKVADYLFEAGKLWRTGVAVSLTSMTGIKSLPRNIYLSGGGANLTLIQELLYEDEWRKSLPFTGEPQIETVSSSMWHDQVLDELHVLSGSRMFVPVSLSLVKLELN